MNTVSDEPCNGDPTDILFVEDNPGDVRLGEEAFREERIWNTSMSRPTDEQGSADEEQDDDAHRKRELGGR